MTLGTAVATILVAQLARSRDTNQIDPRTGVSTAFIDAAIAVDSPVRFTDVTAAAGLQLTPEPPRHRALPEDNGSGVAWGDYDGDGWPDLFVVRHTGGNRLFRNNRDGTFTDVTARTGVGNPSDWGMGATWVDVDDDGHLDLYVTNRGPNRLYRNRGDGTFVDVAAAAGVADPLWGTGTAWADFDRDGHIDFYLCNYVTYDSDGLQATSSAHSSSRGGYEAPFTINPSSYEPQPNRLFRNRGDGTFEDVTAFAGVDDAEGRTLDATFCDLDGDGWPDLYVNNDVSRDRLFLNVSASAAGVGKFVDVSAVAGTADPRSSMGLSVGEFGEMTHHADGLPDLFITHWVAEGNALYESQLTPSGTLEYRDKARPVGLGEISLRHIGWGCAAADFDLDGRTDIAVTNGSTLVDEHDPVQLKREPMFIFMNTGTGFRDVANVAGEATRQLRNGRGLAVADFNRDGKPDVVILTTEGVPVLLRNDTATTNQSLTVRLRARAALCFGAKIEVWAGASHATRWYGADVSYLSQHFSDQIFGLGAQPGADRLRVHWTDGTETTLEHVNAGPVTVEHP
jgi:hypothetical protein